MPCGTTSRAYCVWSLGSAACSASRAHSNAPGYVTQQLPCDRLRGLFFPQTDLSGSYLSEKQDDPLLTYLDPHVRVRRWTGSHLSEKQEDTLLTYLDPHVRVRRWNGSYFRSSWSLDILNSWFKCKCWIFWTHELIFCQCDINEILIKDHIHFLECIILISLQGPYVYHQW